VPEPLLKRRVAYLARPNLRCLEQCRHRFARRTKLAVRTFRIVPLTVWLEMRSFCLDGVVVPSLGMRSESFPQSAS
jgi:hypothetical protein